MQIKNFTFKFKKEPDWLFHNLNINFSSEKINVIIGPNGIGKSTLLDFIADADDNRNNKIFEDFPRRERIAYQLQGVPFIGQTTVKKTIDMLLQIDGNDNVQRENPDYIARIYPKKMSELSGGQRRLVVIYGISLLDRDLYLFDEPESGLDPEMSKKVISLIGDIQKSGKKVIMTTHQFSNMSDEQQLYFLSGQRCAFVGSKTELLNLTNTDDISKSYEYLNNKY
ncbi:ABC transporter ATP-binding protein [Companilactobacillus sp. FL22-1]|uniref:ATP-binding cassette domain-containing protein n=1 Tax=Companilactobacillus sp. FL22-1 TaxID=3373892 RepID=UPI0037552647